MPVYVPNSASWMSILKIKKKTSLTIVFSLLDNMVCLGVHILHGGGTVLAFLNNHLPKASRTQQKCIQYAQRNQRLFFGGTISILFVEYMHLFTNNILTKCVFMNFQHNTYVAEIPHFRRQEHVNLPLMYNLLLAYFSIAKWDDNVFNALISMLPAYFLYMSAFFM